MTDKTPPRRRATDAVETYSDLDFPAFLLEQAKDEELTDEVVSRFHEDFENSKSQE